MVRRDWELSLGEGGDGEEEERELAIGHESLCAHQLGQF